MFIKVCGITRERDAVLAAALGVNAIGLVFWPGSRRYVPPSRAREIVASLPATVTAVGVFVDATMEEIEATAARAAIGCVQLHGDETIEACRAVREPVIKAFRVGRGFDASAIDDWPADVAVLLDGDHAAMPGGAGQLADWTIARRVAARRPAILAGGLTPDNVADAIRSVRPYGVDVSSGVEAAPGIKDEDLLRRFVEAARRGSVEAVISS